MTRERDDQPAGAGKHASPRHISMELQADAARVTNLLLEGNKLILTIEAELASSQLKSTDSPSSVSASESRRDDDLSARPLSLVSGRRGDTNAIIASLSENATAPEIEEEESEGLALAPSEDLPPASEIGRFVAVERHHNTAEATPPPLPAEAPNPVHPPAERLSAVMPDFGSGLVRQLPEGLGVPTVGMGLALAEEEDVLGANPVIPPPVPGASEQHRPSPPPPPLPPQVSLPPSPPPAPASAQVPLPPPPSLPVTPAPSSGGMGKVEDAWMRGVTEAKNIALDLDSEGKEEGFTLAPTSRANPSGGAFARRGAEDQTEVEEPSNGETSIRLALDGYDAASRQEPHSKPQAPGLEVATPSKGTSVIELAPAYGEEPGPAPQAPEKRVGRKMSDTELRRQSPGFVPGFKGQAGGEQPESGEVRKGRQEGIGPVPEWGKSAPDLASSDAKPWPGEIGPRPATGSFSKWNEDAAAPVPGLRPATGVHAAVRPATGAHAKWPAEAAAAPVQPPPPLVSHSRWDEAEPPAPKPQPIQPPVSSDPAAKSRWDTVVSPVEEEPAEPSAVSDESNTLGGERHGEPKPVISFGDEDLGEIGKLSAPETGAPAPGLVPTLEKMPFDATKPFEESKPLEGAKPSEPPVKGKDTEMRPSVGSDNGKIDNGGEAGGTTVLIRYTCPKCKTQGMQAVDKVGTVVNCSNCGKAMRLVMKK